MSAGYHDYVPKFIEEDDARIVGLLAGAIANSGIAKQHSKQITIWKEQVILLKRTLSCLLAEEEEKIREWYIALEYELPRRKKRPDAIILMEDRILIIEFKFGIKTYDASARWQVDDYALNLRDFHAESYTRYIVPVLCAVDAPRYTSCLPSTNSSLVAPTQFANKDNLKSIIQKFCHYPLPSSAISEPINMLSWISSPYRPTLTIIEAAERLYGNHSVREISHSYADNLDKTTDIIAQVILNAKQNKKRCICFVTGVPGAGKTLSGLNVVHDPSIRAKQGPSGIFLSGNGPLVKIVREALVINQQKSGRRRQDAAHEVSTFIQNVHQFLRFFRENPNSPPHENVVVFDEAQRAWNRDQMRRKQGVDCSESAELLKVMERTSEWSVIVALVGGGQELFLGEAGLEEWGNAVLDAKENWIVVASPEVLQGGESIAGHRLFAHTPSSRIVIQQEPLAHLSVSVRSHRAQKITQWVNDFLQIDLENARINFPDIREFPFFITRDLNKARDWLKEMSGVDSIQRSGLLCTSEDQRLRAYGLENSTAFRSGYSFEKWFLSDSNDVRSSFMLEVPATEFECQGLELDWVGVCWGGDLTPDLKEMKWDYRKFRGTRWQYCRSEVEQAYIRNRYRVLLTRARSGMVVWVPPGSPTDQTREPYRFNQLYEFFKDAGVPDLETRDFLP